MQIDWEQEKPSSSECRDYLKQNPVFERVDRCGLYEHPLLEAMRQNVTDGEVKFGLFSLKLTPDLEWFISRNRYHEIYFIENFLSSVSFGKAFPDVPPYASPDEMLKCQWSNSYQFAGELAYSLMMEQDFGDYCGTGRETMALAQQFVSDLYQDRYEDVRVFHFSEWSEWFFDRHYDKTWIGVDLEKRMLWTLFQTNDV